VPIVIYGLMPHLHRLAGRLTLKSGDNTKGYYSITDTVPANASGVYYVKAFSTFDDLTVESGCVAITVTHADEFGLTLAITPSFVYGSDPVTFTGDLTNLGPSSVASQPVVVNAYWTNSACSGTPSYHFDATTDSSGHYTTGPIPTGAAPDNYYYSATSNGAVSTCQHFTIFPRAPLYNETAAPGTTWGCSTGATDGTLTTSYVLWARTSTQVSAEIHLVGATPHAAFDVWVEQYPVTCPPGTSTPSNPAAITTDASGNGVVVISFAPAAGATSFWLSLWTPAGSLTGALVLRSSAVSIPTP